MASAIDTANPERTAGAARPGAPSPSRPARRGGRAPRGGAIGSRLGRRIIVLNLLGVAVLVGGALAVNESRQGLVKGRLESLAVQAELIAQVLDQTATTDAPAPALDPVAARRFVGAVFLPRTQRARVYDRQGRAVADSWPPAARPAALPGPARQALTREVAGALGGAPVSDLRTDEAGRRVVSVSIPVRRAGAVVAVLTLEAAEVERLVAGERAALAPFMLLAVGVALLSSVLLIQSIAVPVLRLARAADRVRLARARAIVLPDLAARRDELGDLTRALEAMTATLSERMGAIERFAADVSHELRNPMTSMRSALETLELVKTDAQRSKLIGILNHDIGRLDRLITDISNASRVDAELARNAPAPMDLARLLVDLCEFYTATAKPTDVKVRFVGVPPAEAMMVAGREGPLGQVFRNLIDNARSFSPPQGEVRVFVERSRSEVLARVEDDGPGIPPDNLETVFERFYTARPKGAAFGGNSGLGLAIARQIIETHGGRIWAENREEGGKVAGARFQVALPLA
jgi:two-component system, OmpR family, sensor histidine kinase ChvG